MTTVTKLTLRTLARRALSLEEEVKEIDRLLKTLVAETAPELIAIDGVGTDVASAFLVAAGDNPERLKSEADLRQALRGLTPRCLERQERTPPTQPRWGPPGQLRPLAHRVHPHGVRPENPALHRAPDEGGSDQEGGDPLPQALRGAGGVRSSSHAQNSPLTIHRSIVRGHATDQIERPRR